MRLSHLVFQSVAQSLTWGCSVNLEGRSSQSREPVGSTWDSLVCSHLSSSLTPWKPSIPGGWRLLSFLPDVQLFPSLLDLPRTFTRL